jgi:hypothetical protein
MIANLRNRLNRVCPRSGSRIITQLATAPEMRVHESEVSRWLAGMMVPTAKADRMLAALESLEKVFDADSIRVDMTDVENIRAALARLAERNPAEDAVPVATVPFEQDIKRFRAESTVAPPASEFTKLLAEQ